MYTSQPVQGGTASRKPPASSKDRSSQKDQESRPLKKHHTSSYDRKDGLKITFEERDLLSESKDSECSWGEILDKKGNSQNVYAVRVTYNTYKPIDNRPPDFYIDELKPNGKLDCIVDTLGIISNGPEYSAYYDFKNCVDGGDMGEFLKFVGNDGFPDKSLVWQ